MEGKSLIGVAHESGIVDAYACECVAVDEGNHIAGKDPVVTLERNDGCAWVIKTYGVAPGEEMKLPGAASNSLLIASESVDPVCKSAAIIKEMIVAFGR